MVPFFATANQIVLLSNIPAGFSIRDMISSAR